MNPTLYWTKKGKREQPLPTPNTKSKKPARLSEAEEPISQNGSRIGFWLLPSGDDYVKLPILSSYSMEIPGWLSSDRYDLDIRFGNALAPIWAVVFHREALAGHFPWLSRAFSYVGIEDLFNPTSDKHDESVFAFQKFLIGRNFAFWIQNGQDGYFCGDADVFNRFKEELAGSVIGLPEKVVTDYASVLRINLLDDSGKKRKTIEVPGKPGNSETIASVASKIEGRPYTLADVFKVVKDASAFKGMDDAELSWLFSLHNIRAAQKQTQDAKSKIQLLDAATVFLKYAKEKGLKVNFQAYGPLLKRAGLTEATLRRLLDLTKSNGFYAYGGMLKIGNRWVYDPNVKNRFQNAAFVVPRLPSWTISDDGFTTMNFVVRSRPDRNTTGMNQTGYIKILDDKAGWLTRVGRKIGSVFGKKQSAMDRDVHVHCSCPDHQYRFHWVLSQMGAAPSPVGAGDRSPDKTNPSKRPSLCKHLCAVSSLMNIVPPPRGKVPMEPVAPGKSPTATELAIMDEIED